MNDQTTTAGGEQTAEPKKAPRLKAAKRMKANPVLAEDLRAAIAQVEAGNHSLSRDALVEAMTGAGANFDDRDNAVYIDWLGVNIHTTARLPNALTVWCSKARRAILNGEAE